MEKEITQKQFRTYLDIRDSGKTNMFNVSNVVSLSKGELTFTDCVFIMEHFNGLCDKYAEEEK